MVRSRRKEEDNPSRAERIARAAPMALVPYGYQHPSPSALERRLLKHNALMDDLVRKGLDYTSLPNKILAAIVRDFQIAGIDVPTPALRAVSNTTPRMPQPKKRPAPIAFTPLPETRAVPDTYELSSGDTRDNLLRRGYNPKTGGAPSLPYMGATRALPYAPVHRYTAGMSTRAAESIAATNWLPPWMVEGDQPNQFVKTPREPVRARSKGIGPSYAYAMATTNRLPSASVQAFNARQAQGLQWPLPYTGRVRTVDDRVMRGMGAARDDIDLPVVRRRRIDNLNDVFVYQGAPPPPPQDSSDSDRKRKAPKPLPPVPKKAPKPLPPVPKKVAAIISAVAKDPSTRLSTSPPPSPPSPAVVIPIATPVKKAAGKKAKATAAGPAAAAGQRASKAPVKFTPSKSPVPSAQDIAAAVKDSPLFKARRRKLNMDDDKNKP